MVIVHVFYEKNDDYGEKNDTKLVIRKRMRAIPQKDCIGEDLEKGEIAKNNEKNNTANQKNHAIN